MTRQCQRPTRSETRRSPSALADMCGGLPLARPAYSAARECALLMTALSAGAAGNPEVRGSPIVTPLPLRPVAACACFVTLVSVRLHRKLHHGFEMTLVPIPLGEGGARHDHAGQSHRSAPPTRRRVA